MLVRYALLIVLPLVCDCYQKWSMQTLCRRTVLVHGGELHFDSDGLPLAAQSCSLTLTAERFEDKLSLFFTSYTTGVDCVHTNVSFIDGKSGQPDSELWPGLKQALCSTDKYLNEQQIFSTSGTSITILFRRNTNMPKGRAHSNFTIKVAAFRPRELPCDDTNGTLYSCENGRCVYRDLMCHNLNPCGSFYDVCPDNSTPEPESVHVVVPFLIFLAGMIALFFSCQVFLMIRNGKCPCKHDKGYSSELERQTSNVSNNVTQNGVVKCRDTDQFLQV